MTRTSTWLATLALGLGLTGTAMAGDKNGNFMVRLQGTSVVTQDNLKSLNNAAGTDLTTVLDAAVSNEIVPTLTLTYFFNKNIAVELLCCAAKHDVKISGAANGQGAEMWIFPPALTLQYHFDNLGPVKPYVGVGAQYIHYFSESTGDNILNAGGVNFSDSFGVILQAGFDLAVGDGWYLNADIKKSWLDTKVTWNNVQGLGQGGQSVTGKVDVDPLIISAGLGYRFNLDDIFGRRSAAPLK
ncbi:MAG: OmpW/AlkL family protein [Hyphomicrobiaceae bacterium]